MVTILPPTQKPMSFGQSLLLGAAQAAPQAIENYYAKLAKQKQEQQAQETARKYYGLETGGFDPETRRAALVESMKQGSARADTAQKLKLGRDQVRRIEEERGLEPGSLESFASNPALGERTTRPKTKTQAAQPIDPDQLEKIEKVRNSPDFNEMSEVEQYRALTRAGVSKENAEAESKLRGQELTRHQQEFDKNYKVQQPFIDETTSAYKGFETEMKPRLLQMQELPDEDIIGPTASKFLEHFGIPLGALDDPSSELFQKLSQDLLKGLPETYGSRILKVEVDNFLKTIPTLSNSPEGRRMIASNMLKLGEMKEIYYNEMRRQQQEYLEKGTFPKDFQQRVFDQVKPQIDKFNDEFVKLSSIKHVPKGTIPFFGPNGNIAFVPKDQAQWALENGGKRIW